MDKSGIRTLEDIQREKEKIRKRNAATSEELQSNFRTAKSEGQDFALKKVLIPVGVALLAGYGIRKLLKSGKSESKEKFRASDEENASEYDGRYRRSKSSSGFDWMGTLVKFVPFAISVGQKLYEDGHLSFLFGDTEDDDDTGEL